MKTPTTTTTVRKSNPSGHPPVPRFPVAAQERLLASIREAGSLVAFARIFEVNPKTVSYWVESRCLPAERVLEVEAATGIPCWELRPDLYPPERFAASTPEDPLPCPHCGEENQAGPTYSDDGKTVLWDCECGLTGPSATTIQAAIVGWNRMALDLIAGA